MKLYKIFLILAMSLLMLSAVVYAAADAPSLKVTFINQNPDPARPGEYVDLKFRIDNSGGGTAEDVIIELVDSFPFSLDPGTEPVMEIGNLGSLQEDDLGVVVEYKVRVSSEAIEGYNTLELAFSSKGQARQKLEVNVEVKTQDSGLIIKSVTSDPEMLPQGSKGFVEINIDNPSDSVLRDVTVNLDLSSADLPFAPADSATSKRLKFLSANSVSTFRFGLIPFPDADAKVYKVPIKISYYDSSNLFVETDDTIGIVVGADADVSFSVESEDFALASTAGPLTLKIVNKGLVDVKFLDVLLEDTADYEVVSAKESYIGGVDSDDFETSDFKIVRKSENNPFNVKASVTYRDANNNEYSSDLMLPVKLFNGDEKKSNAGWIVGVIIVVVVYFLVKKLSRRKKK